jgi:beta-lactamase regulating signal transducer with metallopeptidase domain
MKTIEVFFSTELIEALGWTLVHSVWQGTLVALILIIALWFLHKISAQARYFISFSALVLLLGWSTLTFIKSYNYANSKAAVKLSLRENPDYIKGLLLSNENTDSDTFTQSHQFNLQWIKTRAFLQKQFHWILTLWVIGMGFLMLRLAGGLAYTKRLRTIQLDPFEPYWMERINQFCNTLKIKRSIQAFRSPHTQTPLAIGILKPVILFPIAAFTGLTDKEIEAIIVHELAHIRRHDYLFNIFQSIIEILFFYHPAVWLISKYIRTERENSCDNIAISVTGDKANYARALANAEAFALNQQELSMAFTRGTSKGHLLNRIKRLQNLSTMKTNFTEGFIAATVIILGLTLLSFTLDNGYYKSLIDDAEPHRELVLTPYTAKTATTVKPQIKKEERDSLKKVIEKKLKEAEFEEQAKMNRELEKVVEIAYTEQNPEMAANILAEVNAALEEINLAEVIQEAMAEASEALQEAQLEMELENVSKEAMAEAAAEIAAAREEIKREMEIELDTLDEETRILVEESLKAASVGLDAASAVLENLDIAAIIEASLKSVDVALNAVEKSMDDLDLDAEIEAQLKKVEEQDWEKMSEKAKKEHKKQLKKQLKELEKQMQELEEQMKEVKEK